MLHTSVELFQMWEMANGGRFCATLLASVWHLLSHSWDGNSGFFLFAINAAGSVDSKHRQKHGCRGELTMTSSFMNYGKPSFVKRKIFCEIIL